MLIESSVQYLMFHHGTIMALFILSGLMGIVLIAFAGYHLWIASGNTTTNETFKWRDVSWALSRAQNQWDRLTEFIEQVTLTQRPAATMLLWLGLCRPQNQHMHRAPWHALASDGGSNQQEQERWKR